ncbi:MAG TPA: type II toxin-antitoxin system PemK/MazF family toxin [bacterium]|nr:type II toxin-antitoxin system PemK/MazF family toxin [bacterium]
MNRGEIWGFEFKKPDKARPVVILTRQEMIPHLHTVTVAPITRTIRGVTSEVVVGPAEGLKEPSAINLHHLVTVPKSQLRRYIGSLSPSKLSAVLEAMLFALGFDDV